MHEGTGDFIKVWLTMDADDGRKRLIFMLSVSPVSLGRGRDGGGGLVAMATVSGDVEREAEEWSRVERLNSWVPTTQQLTACTNNTSSKSLLASN